MSAFFTFCFSFSFCPYFTVYACILQRWLVEMVDLGPEHHSVFFLGMPRCKALTTLFSGHRSGLCSQRKSVDEWGNVSLRTKSRLASTSYISGRFLKLSVPQLWQKPTASSISLDLSYIAPWDSGNTSNMALWLLLSPRIKSFASTSCSQGNRGEKLQ